jgi:tetrahydromethanopterin S-methyltransferase subunit G
MSTTPIQITTDLSQVLDRLDQRLGRIEKELTDFRTETRVATEEVKGDIKALDTKVDGIDRRLEKVETSQKNQIWALIGILATAVVATAIRFVITALPANP